MKWSAVAHFEVIGSPIPTQFEMDDPETQKKNRCRETEKMADDYNRKFIEKTISLEEISKLSLEQLEVQEYSQQPRNFTVNLQLTID